MLPTRSQRNTKEKRNNSRNLAALNTEITFMSTSQLRQKSLPHYGLEYNKYESSQGSTHIQCL